MKTLLYISILGLLSCNSRTQQSDKKQTIDTTAKVESTHKNDNSKYYTTLDTLIISTEIGDTLKYGKDEFNEIIDNHPELVSDNIRNPDQVYHCNGEREGFNSEAGQDGYFMLYAYFLKNKNGDKKYSERRKKLINIYSNINSLFGHFEYGGDILWSSTSKNIGIC